MTHDLIKELRESTGAGIVEIKNALTEAGGDKEKAIEILRKKGSLKLGKKADRATKEGVVECYIHPGGRIGALVEINCETDFVARTQDFQELAKDLALHVAAANPLYVNSEQVPDEVLEKEKEIYREQIKGKPEKIAAEIIQGKIAKYLEESCLMEQPFVKNPELKVKDLIGQAVAKIGENIQVRRFARFVLGS